MAINSTQKQASNTLVERQILLKWLEEIGKLHDHYQRLNILVRSVVPRNNASLTCRRQVGQCPVTQLITLRDTIRMELKTMLDEIDDLPGHSTSSGSNEFARMQAHNRTLSRLNRQARLRLDLAAQPAT